MYADDISALFHEVRSQMWNGKIRTLHKFFYHIHSELIFSKKGNTQCAPFNAFPNSGEFKNYIFFTWLITSSAKLS